MMSKTIHKGHPSHKVIKGLLANYYMLVIIIICEPELFGIDDLLIVHLHLEIHIE